MISRTSCVALLCCAFISCAKQEPVPEECAPPGDRPQANLPVKLEVVDDSQGNHYLVVTGPQCSDNPSQKGCLTVEKNKVGKITFNLHQGRDHDCRPGAGEWRLDGMQLSMQAKVTNGTVTEAVKCDFGTDDQGRVQNPDFPGVGLMRVEDRNNEAYDVFYTVTAVSCETGEKLSTDPWIKNRGTD